VAPPITMTPSPDKPLERISRRFGRVLAARCNFCRHGRV